MELGRRQAHGPSGARRALLTRQSLIDKTCHLISKEHGPSIGSGVGANLSQRSTRPGSTRRKLSCNLYARPHRLFCVCVSRSMLVRHARLATRVLRGLRLDPSRITRPHIRIITPIMHAHVSSLVLAAAAEEEKQSTSALDLALAHSSSLPGHRQRRHEEPGALSRCSMTLAALCTQRDDGPGPAISTALELTLHSVPLAASRSEARAVDSNSRSCSRIGSFPPRISHCCLRPSRWIPVISPAARAAFASGPHVAPARSRICRARFHGCAARLRRGVYLSLLS